MRKLQLISTKNTTIKRLLIFIPLIFLSITIFAAFPVNTDLNDIGNVVSKNHLSTELPVYGDSPVSGILSLFFGILGIISYIFALSLHSYIYLTFGLVLSALAIILGIKGSGKRLKGFAISGLILGGIGVILGIICFIVAGLDYGRKGEYSFNKDDDYTWGWRFNGYEGY